MTDLSVTNAFHVTFRPCGSSCNLHCDYRVCSGTTDLCPKDDPHMTEEVVESCMRQVLEAGRDTQVDISWRGGEPALMGLEFFRLSVQLQKAYQKPEARIENRFQTNGTLIDDEWCEFFHMHDFHIDLSMAGPRELHDISSKDGNGRGTFHQVFETARKLKEYEIRHTILCTVNRMNGRSPLPVYHFFRDELKAGSILFIPYIVCIGDRCPQRDPVTEQSVRPHQWGHFLMEIFDEWVGKDVEGISILNFDSILARRLGRNGPICSFWPDCGKSLTIEYNGDVYSCTRSKDPGRYLGNVLVAPLKDLVASERHCTLGDAKRNALPRTCTECSFLSVCNGGCPGNRFSSHPQGESGLNYLCAGEKAFFRHSDRAVGIMADLIRQGQPVSHIMYVPAQTAAEPGSARNSTSLM